MSRSIRWLFAMMLLLLTGIDAVAGTENRTKDYTWLLFLEVNEPPQVDAGNNQGISGDTALLSASVIDDPKDTLTYAWVKASGPGSVWFDNASAKQTLVTFSVSGTYTLKFTADDGEFESSDTVVITVTNTPPNVNAGGDKQITHPTHSVSLNGSVSDSENNIEGIVWSKVSGPGGVAFSNPSNVTTNVTFSSGATGTYVLRLSANDWEYTSSDTVTVTYLSQPAPQIDVVVAVGDSITVGFGDQPSCQPVIPGTPLEEIDKTCNGYTVPLANRLAGAKGYADTVYIRERGTVGVTSYYGRTHIQSITNDHPYADQYLVMYGTNDAGAVPAVPSWTFKANMQQIINTIKAAGAKPVLAKAPYVKDGHPNSYNLNQLIYGYNQAVHELYLSNSLGYPPDFYTYFKNHQDQINTYNINTGAGDYLHPTHEGYDVMANAWKYYLTQ